MKKTLLNKMIIHALITLIIFVALFSLDVWNDSRIDSILGSALAVRFNLADSIQTRLDLAVYFFIAFIPFLLAIYFSYKIIFEHKRLQLLKIILFPLLGAITVPAFFYLKAVATDSIWTGVLGLEIAVVNLACFIVNEILILIAFKKEHLKT
jgi:hypothetical protein